MAKDVEQNIESQIEETNSPAQNAALAQAQEKPKQVYKLDPVGKIPVSRFEGPVWEGRKTAGLKRLSDLFTAWSEAEAYYSNTQMNHRRASGGESAGNEVQSKNRNRKFSMTENLVYATVNAVIPSTYAKNPDVSVTMYDDDEEKIGPALKNLANNLANMEYAPGIGLKSKVRKSIIRTELTNEAWALVGYTLKEQSADQAQADIADIGKKLVEAKDPKEIEELEGKLMALEESCDLLDPSGPFVKTVRGADVIVDDMSTEDDHSDANWIMVAVMMSTAYLNARYRKQNVDGQWVSEYKPSHVVDAVSATAGVSEEQREIDNFKIFDAGKDKPSDYGYKSQQAYDRAKRTKCWYCFDRVKRRFYLYSDADWTWPVWVFEDPYHLPRFFPLRKLMYHSDPTANRTKGEVSHYLDQQDALNTIADEMNRSRTAARDRVLFDSGSLTQTDVENIMLSSDRKAVGVKVPEGKKLAELLMGPPMPVLEHKHLWDKQPIMSAINQISGLGDAMRGEQYKTNTTNQAIESYNSINNVRLDEKRDAIEDFIGGIMYDVIFLCLQFMPVDMMADVGGKQYGPVYQSLAGMSPADIRRQLNMRVIGGSTQKPTSAAKKAETLQMSQILGQFAGASPYALVLAIKAFQRSFDGFTVTERDWEALLQMMMMQLQKAGAGPNGEGGGGEAEAEGSESGGAEDAAEEPDDQEKPLVDEAVKRGVPRKKAIELIRKKMAQQRSQQPQQVN